MPINGDSYDFTWANVNNAPERHGVYALYRNGRLVYCGRAAGAGVTIRSRLQSHKRGDEGPCTANATRYRREVTESPVSRERELLQEFVQQYGRLPECNDVMP